MAAFELVKPCTPRLDVIKLPLVWITQREFIVLRQSQHAVMTPMRDAKVAGPAIRDAHRNAGRYLESPPFPHYNGNY
jgi:hypothetical protein